MHVLKSIDLSFSSSKTVSNHYLFYSNTYADLVKINCLISAACINLSSINILYI
jgi:hypothetical protein